LQPSISTQNQVAAEAAQQQLLEAEMTRVLQGRLVLSTALGSRCSPPRGEAVALTSDVFYHILSPQAAGATGFSSISHRETA
jgi:hypothetical protein